MSNNIVDELIEDKARELVKINGGFPPRDAHPINGDPRYKYFFHPEEYDFIDAHPDSKTSKYNWLHEKEHYEQWLLEGFAARIGVKVRYLSERQVDVALFVNPVFDERWHVLSEVERIEIQIRTISAPNELGEDDKKGLKLLKAELHRLKQRK